MTTMNNTMTETNTIRESSITKIKISKVLRTSGNMPIAVLSDGTADVGFLSPFRGYKFQVSGTFDGQRDMGSTQVIGLGNVMCVNRSGIDAPIFRSNCDSVEIRKELLKGLASLAIADFSSRHDYAFDMGSFRKLTETVDGFGVWGNDLDIFIEAVYDYLNRI